MSQIIQAIYENGVLRPLTPLPLKQNQIIRIEIEHDSKKNRIESVLQSLAEEGLLTPPTGCAEDNPASEAERLRLAETIGKVMDKPVSEIIMEERS